MARKEGPREPGRWDVADLLLNLFGDLEGLCGLVRFVGHLLFVAARAVFHLLTCHF